MDGREDTGRRPPLDLRVDIPHPARMYDYFLGGKDNFPADREAAEAALAFFPSIRATAVQARRFMTRVVAELAEAGVRQFLDIGTSMFSELYWSYGDDPGRLYPSAACSRRLSAFAA